MNTPNIEERLVEEIVTKIMTFSEEIFDFDRYDSHLDIRRYENFLREKLTSALSQARQEGREETIQKLANAWRRDEEGNVLHEHYYDEIMEVLQEPALTTEGK